jgi:hypothetical protein
MEWKRRRRGRPWASVLIEVLATRRTRSTLLINFSAIQEDRGTLPGRGRGQALRCAHARVLSPGQRGLKKLLDTAVFPRSLGLSPILNQCPDEQHERCLIDNRLELVVEVHLRANVEDNRRPWNGSAEGADALGRPC